MTGRTVSLKVKLESEHTDFGEMSYVEFVDLALDMFRDYLYANELLSTGKMSGDVETGLGYIFQADMEWNVDPPNPHLETSAAGNMIPLATISQACPCGECEGCGKEDCDKESQYPGLTQISVPFYISNRSVDEISKSLEEKRIKDAVDPLV